MWGRGGGGGGGWCWRPPSCARTPGSAARGPRPPSRWGCAACPAPPAAAAHARSWQCRSWLRCLHSSLLRKRLKLKVAKKFSLVVQCSILNAVFVLLSSTVQPCSGVHLSLSVVVSPSLSSAEVEDCSESREWRWGRGACCLGGDMLLGTVFAVQIFIEGYKCCHESCSDCLFVHRWGASNISSKLDVMEEAALNFLRRGAFSELVSSVAGSLSLLAQCWRTDGAMLMRRHVGDVWQSEWRVQYLKEQVFWFAKILANWLRSNLSQQWEGTSMRLLQIYSPFQTSSNIGYMSGYMVMMTSSSPTLAGTSRHQPLASAFSSPWRDCWPRSAAAAHSRDVHKK